VQLRLSPANLHPWRVSPGRARAIQSELAARVRIEPPHGPLRLIAGLDAAFSSDGKYCLAAVVLWDLQTGELIEQRVAQRRLYFPYIPGLLSFREAPSLLAALRKLEQQPHVLLCDGQGIAHPRRLGIASHLGVLCNLPSVGCAKSRLIGSHAEPGPQRGAWAPLYHAGTCLGSVLRTRSHVRPVYVSAGHLLDLPTARKLVLRCALRYRLPEPTHLADRLVSAGKVSSVPT
jgi:deoxyribonuclease V